MISKLPVFLLKNIVLLPNTTLRLEINTEKEKNIIKYSEENAKNQLFIASNFQDTNKDVKIEELEGFGILAKINSKIILPNGNIRLVIVGIKRIESLDFVKDESILISELSNDIEYDKDEIKEKALFRKIIEKLDKLIVLAPNISNSIINELESIDNLEVLTDVVCGFLPTNIKRKIEYIPIINPIDRAKMLLTDIDNEIKVLEIETNIDNELKTNISSHEKEFILKEKMKLIKSELGEDDNSEINEIKEKIEKINSKHIKERLIKELKRFEDMNIASPEYSMTKSYIDTLLSIPLDNYTIDSDDLNEAKKVLDNSHYGLDDIKERIIEFLALKINSKNISSPIICLVGPPGVGKTTLARSIADSIGRNFTKISVGGINDEAEIMGHRKTYIGALPGKIINGLIRAKSMNPVFLIDEIDKMTKDIKGDPASALLEVLDKEQNKYFKDHYVDEEIDLSKVMFILTANNIYDLPEPLKDRLEIIELSSYTEYEKVKLARQYLIPNIVNEYNIDINNIEMSDETLLYIIKNYTKEAGVRELYRLLCSILRKIIKKMVITKDNEVTYKVNKKNIEDYLGRIKYFDTELSDTVGSVNGMSYTEYGGDILPIEVTYYNGNGNLVLTGSLGDVIKESATIALNYIKSNKDKFKIKMDFNKVDIHIHFSEGAVKKEGPSAGIAITTALLSSFKETEIDKTISFTGEITLHGKVLPIGGLKEKVLGSYRSGVKTIIIPNLNEKDLKDIPESIYKEIKFITVKNYSEIYELLFK